MIRRGKSGAFVFCYFWALTDCLSVCVIFVVFFFFAFFGREGGVCESGERERGEREMFDEFSIITQLCWFVDFDIFEFFFCCYCFRGVFGFFSP